MTIQHTNPLHLYRAILRETTYLFDRNARHWTYTFVKSSFRKHVIKFKGSERVELVSDNATRILSQHERQLLKRGRKFLVSLERANQGYQRQLRNILQLTYGRKGRLKRTLTSPYIHASPQYVSDTIDVDEVAEDLDNGHTKPPEKFSKQWKAPEDFISLLHAQNQLSPYLSIRRSIRLKSPIDEKNKWGRPMPPSRIKNTNKKWYAKMAAAFMPPLPEQEWDRLKAIAQRKHEFKIMPRRSTAQQSLECQNLEDAEYSAEVILSGVNKKASYKTSESIKSPHKLTPRFLSRFYARHILNHVPVAASNPVGRGIVSKWDDAKRNTLAPARPKDNAQLEALFG